MSTPHMNTCHVVKIQQFRKNNLHTEWNIENHLCAQGSQLMISKITHTGLYSFL